MHCSIAPVLLVHQTATKSAPLIDHLASQKIPMVATNNFSGIEAAKTIKNYSMILYDWELFQTQQDNPQHADSVNELFDSSLPVIFFSALQSASVKFRQVNSRSVYSMKTSDIATVFDAISELAKQVDCSPLRPTLGPTLGPTLMPTLIPSTSQPLNRGAKAKGSSSIHEPAPHFFPSLVVDAANLNSCVHGLY